MNTKHIAFSIAMLSMSIGSAIHAEAPSGYYSKCENLGGKTLLTALRETVGPHTTISYSGLWDLYKTSDVDENGKIWDMYSTKRWTPGKEQCGSYSGIGDCYNREHSMPKSWFNDASPMYSDAFHLYPTDGYVNNQRGNYPFGECANGKQVASSGNVKPLGRRGTSTFPGYSGEVFEPDDLYKGDFARSYFYMAAAYNDRIGTWKSDMLANNSYPAFSSWAVELLLKWHRMDPVSQKEIDRNEAVYAKQKNRNPFIDHPEMAEYIWGNKKNEKWSSTITADPTLNLPADGSEVDFGLTAPGYSVSRSIPVKGTNLSSDVILSVNSADFTLSATSLKASVANSDNGAVSVTYRPTSAGTSTATLTVSCGTLTSSVTLRAKAVDGIPALEATDIDATSFTANWRSLGDSETYTLTVLLDGTPISGYPLSVLAELEEHAVTGLNPETTYTYQLSTPTKTSNIVSVTTDALNPSAQIIHEGAIHLSAEPAEPSAATELIIDIENITSPLTITVSSPFELSTDKSSWSRSITIDPEEDRFYIRLGAADTGQYNTSITISAGNYVNDDTVAEGFVVDTSTPWFVETFETLEEEGGYYPNKSITGSASVWNINNVGFWTNEAHNGKWSARLGKDENTNCSLTTASPKKQGIGTISFYGCRWPSSKDGNVSLNVEYSSDNGATWKSAGTADMDTDDYKEFKFVVNTTGDNLIRLRRTAGKRGKIDDITVTDYIQSGIGSIESADDWDAYCLDGRLVIESDKADATFLVYNLEGISLAEITSINGSTSISLPAGLYIVTDNVTSRRVLVK